MKRSNEDQQDHAVKRSQPTMLHNGNQLPVSPNLSAGSPSPPRKKEVRRLHKRRVAVERLASSSIRLLVLVAELFFTVYTPCYCASKEEFIKLTKSSLHPFFLYLT